MGTVQPGTFTTTCREGLVEEGGVDDADDGLAGQEESDGDAEHGEDVDVVDRSWGEMSEFSPEEIG